MLGFQAILPFLMPVHPYIEDEAVTDIMINADGSVFVECCGLLKDTGVAINAPDRRDAAVQIMRRLGKDIVPGQRPGETRLEDGSRVSVCLEPVSPGGAAICIRKFRKQRFTSEELVEREMLTAAELLVIRRHIERRGTVLFSGATGS